MDATRFDRLAKTLSASASRRGALGALWAGIACPLLFGPEAEAGKRGGKGKGRSRGKDRGGNKRKHENRGQGASPRSVTAESPCYPGTSCAVGANKNLSKCNLSGTAALKNKTCKGCNLSKANLTKADARGANLQGANLSEACMVDTDLTGATFSGVNTSGAILCRTKMTNGSINNSGCSKGTNCCPTCAAIGAACGGNLGGGCCGGATCQNGVCACPTDKPRTCGGTCQECCTDGHCPSGKTCQDGRCTGCQPDCQGKECGPDGCDGNCGACPSGQSCNGQGRCVCTLDCQGKQCGSDGCSGSCGTCANGQNCQNGQCVCTPDCQGKICGDDGCGGSCGSCPAHATCRNNGVACDCDRLLCGAACCAEDNLCCGDQCVAGTCCVDGDCANSTPICRDHACAACQNDGQCGNGKVCCDGACEGGDCCGNGDCGNSTPICQGNTCRVCQSNGECGNGRVCCGGECRSGDCCNNNQCTNQTPICVSNSCTACSSHGQCASGDLCCSGQCLTVACCGTNVETCAPADACQAVACDQGDCAYTFTSDNQPGLNCTASGEFCCNGLCCTSGQVCYDGNRNGNLECCTPATTCPVAACGPFDDGCGSTIDCGPCAEEICQDAVCTSNACDYSPSADNAPGTLCRATGEFCCHGSCCVSGQVCYDTDLDGNLECCTPEAPSVTCAGGACGFVTNNCGQSVDCGSCPRVICQDGSCLADNTCGYINSADGQPGTLCEEAGAFCCSGACCASPQVCFDGDQNGDLECCTPLASCPADACGALDSGCGGTIDCGACPDVICQDGTCSGNACGYTLSPDNDPGTLCVGADQFCCHGSCCASPEVCFDSDRDGNPECCTPEATATTCAAGKCGLVTNNCGQEIDCGSCPPVICQDGACLADNTCRYLDSMNGVPGTLCEAAGELCCGGACCTSPQVCFDGNQDGDPECCTPLASCLANACGLVDDGCGGVIDCHQCPAVICQDAACTSNTCGYTLSTDSLAGPLCDGTNEFCCHGNCCTSPQVCFSAACCTPGGTCPANYCGSVSDGCGRTIACTCGSGLTCCGTVCVDTSSDVANCGSCSNACATGDTCQAGACGETCGSDFCQAAGANPDCWQQPLQRHSNRRGELRRLRRRMRPAAGLHRWGLRLSLLRSGLLPPQVGQCRDRQRAVRSQLRHSRVPRREPRVCR